MDRPQPISDNLRLDLENLAKLNRRFGGYDLIRHFLHRWIAPSESVSLLDLCTGSGDIPGCIADLSRAQKSIFKMHAVEFQHSSLSIPQAKSVLCPELNFATT